MYYRATCNIVGKVIVAPKKYTYDNGILSLTRYVDSSDNSIAHYKYDYNPTISGSISWEKEGKWRPINLFKWRHKVWQVNLVSNDTNMKFENTKFIYVGKRRK